MKIKHIDWKRNRSRVSAKLFFTCILILLGCFQSCNKFVEVPSPSTKLVGPSVFKNNSSAVAAISGIFQSLVASDFIASINFTEVAGLSSDEFSLYSGGATPFLTEAYKNSILTNDWGVRYWSKLYNCIYQCNAAIDGLSSSTGVSSTLKQQLIGEAQFVRAFCYFYLVNIFGDVPLTTTSDYTINQSLARVPAAKVYQQIVGDLKSAQSQLSDNFLTSSGSLTTERTLPNKTAATALLARVYLYTKDYADAETLATTVINNTSNASLVSNLNSVFLKNSNEALWQLPPVQSGYNTYDGYTFVLNPGGLTTTRPVYLSPQLLSAFEVGDLRQTNWVSSYQGYSFAYKYKVQGGPVGTPVTEYLTVLRLAEQYLIRSEARARQNSNLAGAIADLNTIRNRAGLPNTTATTQADIINAIQHERQVELFAEMGHRWLDLKRTGAIDSVMTTITSQKGGSWNSNAQLFPIPVGDITADPNLKQNPGYN